MKCKDCKAFRKGIDGGIERNACVLLPTTIEVGEDNVGECEISDIIIAVISMLHEMSNSKKVQISRSALDNIVKGAMFR